MIENMLQDKWLFFSKFMRSPKTIGSVVPSSRFLAAKMVSAVPWERASAIAELGCGTGAITKFIRNANCGDASVLLFEKDPLLRNELMHRYPEYICCSDAFGMRGYMEMAGIRQLDAVISGLPFFNFAETAREQLLEEIDYCLKPGGQFVAFQYTLQMKKALQRKFAIESISFVPWNVPPAFVYVCRKK
ncbi:class I SAM-dependent methyltransferase [Paenibacillus hamazuiensis]|uniref:class I SAM-dependent methyltransferase n=1 Tax=Paenibacillus hamazuiensis TaxID=2936508 RepID=UPI00200C09AC|nr:methyltransferase domain-containing protein [Paenibacillus hamazuiensis]